MHSSSRSPRPRPAPRTRRACRASTRCRRRRGSRSRRERAVLAPSDSSGGAAHCGVSTTLDSMGQLASATSYHPDANARRRDSCCALGFVRQDRNRTKKLDWHRTPLKQMTASKTGGVEFEMAIPETGCRAHAPDEGWGPTTGDPFKRPSVTIQNVSADMASSLESAISSAGAKPENVVRKDQRRTRATRSPKRKSRR